MEEDFIFNVVCVCDDWRDVLWGKKGMWIIQDLGY